MKIGTLFREVKLPSLPPVSLPNPPTQKQATDFFEAAAPKVVAYLNPKDPTDKKTIDARATASVKTVEDAFRSAPASEMPRLRTTARAMAAELDAAGYTAQGAQIRGIAEPIHYNAVTKTLPPGGDQKVWATKIKGDPRDMNAVRAYFASLPDSQVMPELDKYMNAFFVHPGNGVMSWDNVSSAEKAGLDQPAALNGMLNEMKRSPDGRTMANCTGYSLVAGSILKACPGFEMKYAGTTDHMWVVAAKKSEMKAGATTHVYTVSTADQTLVTDQPRRVGYLPLRAFASPGIAGDRPDQAWASR